MFCGNLIANPDIIGTTERYIGSQWKTNFASDIMYKPLGCQRWGVRDTSILYSCLFIDHDDTLKDIHLNPKKNVYSNMMPMIVGYIIIGYLEWTNHLIYVIFDPRITWISSSYSLITPFFLLVREIACQTARKTHRWSENSGDHIFLNPLTL